MRKKDSSPSKHIEKSVCLFFYGGKHEGKFIPKQPKSKISKNQRQ